jgi:hypothetical protein
LSVAPSAILKHELKSITDTSASRTRATLFSRLHSGPAQRPRLLNSYKCATEATALCARSGWVGRPQRSEDRTGPASDAAAEGRA